MPKTNQVYRTLKETVGGSKKFNEDGENVFFPRQNKANYDREKDSPNGRISTDICIYDLQGKKH
jgi:hypothetical protein